MQLPFVSELEIATDPHSVVNLTGPINSFCVEYSGLLDIRLFLVVFLYNFSRDASMNIFCGIFVNKALP